MSEHLDHHQKLMEMVVDKVLRKHGVLKNISTLNKKEKREIAEIVESIKNEVETYLENTKISKTEKDFPDTNLNDATDVVEKIVNNKPKFKGDNDLKTVKTFLNKK